MVLPNDAQTSVTKKGAESASCSSSEDQLLICWLAALQPRDPPVRPGPEPAVTTLVFLIIRRRALISLASLINATQTS